MVLNNKYYAYIGWCIFFCIAFASCKSDEQPTAEQAYFEDYESPIDKWGFVDTTGNYVIEPIYDDLRPFNRGLALANFEGKWGFINPKGEAVVPHVFRAVFPFHNGLARIQNFDKKYGYINYKGMVVLLDTFNLAFDFHDELARVQYGDLYGFIDINGQWKIKPKFNKADNFENGYAAVHQFGFAALIDTNGELVVDYDQKYSRIYPMSANYSRAKKGKLYYYLPMNDPSAALGPYDKAIDYQDDGYAAYQVDKVWYLMDTAQNKIELPAVDYIQYAGHGMWIIEKNKNFGIVTNQNEIVAPPEYSLLYPFKEGKALFERNGLWGFLDKHGDVVIDAKFPLAWSFHEGKARIVSGGAIGYINSDGSLSFQYGFKDAHDFSEGYAHVK